MADGEVQAGGAAGVPPVAREVLARLAGRADALLRAACAQAPARMVAVDEVWSGVLDRHIALADARALALADTGSEHRMSAERALALHDLLRTEGPAAVRDLARAARLAEEPSRPPEPEPVTFTPAQVAAMDAAGLRDARRALTAYVAARSGMRVHALDRWARNAHGAGRREPAEHEERASVARLAEWADQLVGRPEAERRRLAWGWLEEVAAHQGGGA